MPLPVDWTASTSVSSIANGQAKTPAIGLGRWNESWFPPSSTACTVGRAGAGAGWSCTADAGS